MKGKITSILVALSLLGWGAIFVQPAWADIIYITPAGSTTLPDNVSVNAKADFAISSGSITLTLTNLFQNPTSAGQLISAITFDVTGATGSGSLTTVNNGLISTIDTSNGTYTAGTSDALTRWHASESSTTIDLTALTGGQPDHLIIGPDSAGGFTGAGLYSNANSSIGNFNPSVLGSATFDITIPGVTSASTLSHVVFQFGTDDGHNLITGVVSSPVPIPGAVWLLGSGLIGLAGIRRRFRK